MRNGFSRVTQAVHHSGRRLAAVLVADVAGYVRLVEADEDGVHQRIFRLRREIIDPAVAEAGGRVVKNTGDGFFATFDTVREAFECAQSTCRAGSRKSRAGSRRTNRIAFRMAVNLCELIEHEGDVFGDGVNIAARLQHFAPAGGLALSAAAREQLGRRDELAIKDLGYLRLKHLERPVRALA